MSEPNTPEELSYWLRENSYDPWRFGDGYGAFKVVDIKDWGDGRWARNEEVIVEHITTGEFYSFEQAIGLTEMQESEVLPDLTRVRKEVKQVEMTFWVSDE